MKKYLMSILALVFGIGMAQAGPVSESQAKYVGQQFVQANFGASLQAAKLEMVYTGLSTRGETSFYVFNVGNSGFVIVSADDNYRPIVGYSEESIFDVNNLSPECAYYLNSIADGRNASKSNVADPKVVAEWKSITKNGKLISRNNGRGVDFLVQARWDQNPAPYNSMCPVEPAASDGHAVTGCVATAMAQLMHYWKYPTQGQGSHSYMHSVYGQQTANFGATTYDWDNMLNNYSGGNYTAEQGNAVALIDYHCGVAVDMDYDYASSDPNSPHQGSGALSESVIGAISSYFRYTTMASLQARNTFTLAAWQDKLKEQFDMGWPVYYAGRGAGGHAFICDGYDDFDMFHFNWGWGGYQNGYFAIDALEPGSSTFNNDQRAIINFVPSDIYNNTPQAPTNFNVVPAEGYALSATLTWTNPTKNLQNTNLTQIDQIVVTRNGEIIYTEDNVAPGASMTIVDNTVPLFDAFDYKVYAVTNGAHGKLAKQNSVMFGPSCNWTITVTKAAINGGYRGGTIHIYNSVGTEFDQVTTNSSSIQTFNVDMPLGMVSFGWSAPTQGDAFDMGFMIKNSENATVYTYNASSADMPVGVFFETNNTCGNAVGTEAPSNMVAVVDSENPNNIHVSWDGVSNTGYGYVVYRDDQMYRLLPEATSFIDENAPIGGHCYYVGVLSEGGENGMYSNESCATSGACYPPTNLDYETTGANFKIKLKWERPNPSDGLTGYYLDRKTGEDGTYTTIKLVSASSTSYTDNPGVEGDYYYRLRAYYRNMDDCVSSPAAWKYDDNQFYLHAYYSPTGVEESANDGVKLYPNPAKDNFTVVGEGLTHVTVFNAIGQMVYDASCEGQSTQISMNGVESGVYMVRIATETGVATKRISIVR